MTGKDTAIKSVKTAGAKAALAPEEKLSGDMLLFSTGLMMFARSCSTSFRWALSFGRREL